MTTQTVIFVDERKPTTKILEDDKKFKHIRRLAGNTGRLEHWMINLNETKRNQMVRSYIFCLLTTQKKAAQCLYVKSLFHTTSTIVCRILPLHLTDETRFTDAPCAIPAVAMRRQHCNAAFTASGARFASVSVKVSHANVPSIVFPVPRRPD